MKSEVFRHLSRIIGRPSRIFNESEDWYFYSAINNGETNYRDSLLNGFCDTLCHLMAGYRTAIVSFMTGPKMRKKGIRAPT